MSLTILTDASILVPGNWYAVGVYNSAGKIEWGGMPLYKYEGEGFWVNDDGDPVETTWDSVMQANISINNADAFMQQ